jgi:hypothetical protein
MKDVVHQGMKCRGGIREAERHHQELVVVVVAMERPLGHVIRVHPHLMVAGTLVELGEEASPVDLIEKLIHHRYGKLVHSDACSLATLRWTQVHCPTLQTLASDDSWLLQNFSPAQ